MAPSAFVFRSIDWIFVIAKLLDVACDSDVLPETESVPPTEVLPANCDVALELVATKYCAPTEVASTPAANVEVAEPLMAIERDDVGARSPPAFNSNAFPNIDVARA